MILIFFVFVHISKAVQCPSQLQPPRYGCRQILEVVMAYVGVPHADDGLLQLLDVLGDHGYQLELHLGTHVLDWTQSCTLTFPSIFSPFFFPMSAVEHFSRKTERLKIILF